jgi:ribosomal-protein-alanine N-acetyltransferase
LIRLVRANLDLLHAALAGDDSLARALVHDVVAGWATFTKALQLTRDALAADPGGAAWGTRFFLTDDPPELVGWGGFKGPPRNGVVELGYEIAEARQGRGLATAATRAMVAEAFADERVTAVIAHTLAERNASNRVLEKVGFQREGDAQQDGEVVWQPSGKRRMSCCSHGGIAEGAGAARECFGQEQTPSPRVTTPSKRDSASAPVTAAPEDGKALQADTAALDESGCTRRSNGTTVAVALDCDEGGPRRWHARCVIEERGRGGPF